MKGVQRLGSSGPSCGPRAHRQSASGQRGLLLRRHLLLRPARFGTHADAEILTDYLDRYLSAPPSATPSWPPLVALLHRRPPRRLLHPAQRPLGPVGQ
ncbi:DUF6000 family protein [Streptomyces sp. NPDC053720]|uniref:DUF6000 family protein n=1 Tax=Streptomyces sp. NPDC053720 TaxID=3154855 RepID=UPI0034499ED8